MKPSYALGVDLGGTKISAGIVSRSGEITGDITKIPTEPEKPAEGIVSNICFAIEKTLKTAGCSLDNLDGIGIGSPGPLDIDNGIILTPRNLPSLHNFALKEAISKRLNTPVYINNDGNLFVLGESWFGGGRDANIVYGVTLGTGFGSGFVINKKIFNGSTGTAAEIWCFPYRDGIIEDYVSGRGITKSYKDKTGKEIEPKEIADNALKGDLAAVKVWIEFGEHLGVALSYAVNVVDPEIIIIGGSISKNFNLFSESLDKTLRKHINPIPAQRLKVVPAQLGDNAGLIGAACLVF